MSGASPGCRLPVRWTASANEAAFLQILVRGFSNDGPFIYSSVILQTGVLARGLAHLMRLAAAAENFLP